MNIQTKTGDILSEQALLGSILLTPDAITKVENLLYSEDFTDPKHKKIYQAISKIRQDNNDIDVVTVSSQLKRNKQFKYIGGEDYLNQLIHIVPTSAHIATYADTVIKSSIKRLLHNLVEDVKAAEDTNEILDTAIQRLGQLSARTSKIDSDLISPPDIQAVFAKTSSGLKFGFNGLDSKALIHRAALTVIKGRSKSGKTTFMQHLAQNIINQKQNAYFFSYEMSFSELFCRFLMMFGGEEGVFATHNHLEQVRTLVRNHSAGKKYEKYAPELDMISAGQILPSKEIEYLLTIYKQLVKMLEDKRLFILCTPYSIDLLSQQLQYIADNDTKPVIFIDYIQKIATNRQFGTRQLELQHISAKLLAAAVQFDLPIVVGSQVNAEGDTREAMDIEQDANTIIRLEKEKAKDKIRCSVDKNRNGKEGNADELELKGGAFLLCPALGN